MSACVIIVTALCAQGILTLARASLCASLTGGGGADAVSKPPLFPMLSLAQHERGVHNNSRRRVCISGAWQLAHCLAACVSAVSCCSHLVGESTLRTTFVWKLGFEDDRHSTWTWKVKRVAWLPHTGEYNTLRCDMWKRHSAHCAANNEQQRGMCSQPYTMHVPVTKPTHGRPDTQTGVQSLNTLRRRERFHSGACASRHTPSPASCACF